MAISDLDHQVQTPSLISDCAGCGDTPCTCAHAHEVLSDKEVDDDPSERDYNRD